MLGPALPEMARMKRLAVLALVLPLLAACVEPVMDEPDRNACGAAALQGLVGQPEAVLASMTLTVPVRVIRPGQAVTMDFNPSRLNFDIDERGRIARIWCG
jgi:hypothetical protein